MQTSAQIGKIIKDKGSALMEVIVVYVTVSSTEEGYKIAEALVEDRLAACVNRLGPCQSVYRWQGQMCKDEEFLLVIKTQRALLEPLTQRVCELHSYDVPEVIALPVIGGSDDYLNWIQEETSHA